MAITLNKNLSYISILDLIVRDGTKTSNNLNEMELEPLEIPRPNPFINGMQISYCNGILMMAPNCDFFQTIEYPATMRTLTNSTTISSILISPIKWSMETVQSYTTQISSTKVHKSKFNTKYLRPPRSSLTYSKMLRSIPPTT